MRWRNRCGVRRRECETIVRDIVHEGVVGELRSLLGSWLKAEEGWRMVAWCMSVAAHSLLRSVMDPVCPAVVAATESRGLFSLLLSLPPTLNPHVDFAVSRPLSLFPVNRSESLSTTELLASVQLELHDEDSDAVPSKVDPTLDGGRVPRFPLPNGRIATVKDPLEKWHEMLGDKLFRTFNRSGDVSYYALVDFINLQQYVSYNLRGHISDPASVTRLTMRVQRPTNSKKDESPALSAFVVHPEEANVITALGHPSASPFDIPRTTDTLTFATASIGDKAYTFETLFDVLDGEYPAWRTKLGLRTGSASDHKHALSSIHELLLSHDGPRLAALGSSSLFNSICANQS
jgi:hypothetical protein